MNDFERAERLRQNLDYIHAYLEELIEYNIPLTPNGLLQDVKNFIETDGSAPVERTVRLQGWYWVRKENIDGEFDDWTPAFWNADIKKFYSAFFGGVSDSSVIVGEELKHDPSTQ
jgi:hypothetical protein